MAKFKYNLMNHEVMTRDMFYHAAKNHNDYYSASRVISNLVDDDFIKKTLTDVPNNTIVVPITSKSNSGNILPVVFAEHITNFDANKNLLYNDKIKITKIASHTSKSGKSIGILKRMLTPPIVSGEIIKGANYLLVDDVATSGTTMKSVSNYIRKNGGNVLNYVTIAKAFTNKGDFTPIESIDISSTTIDKMLKKFTVKDIDKFIEEFKPFGYQELEDFTDEDLKYLYKFNRPENLRKYINENLKDFTQSERTKLLDIYSKQNQNYNPHRIVYDPNKETIKVIIAGGRDYANYSFMKKQLNSLFRNVKNTHNITILTGGAQGADRLAEFYAKTHNFKVEKFIPDWNKYASNNPMKKNPAGVIRNKEMVDEGTHLVAFWDGVSNGTKNTILTSHKANLKIRVYSYDNKVLDVNKIINNNNNEQLNLF